MGEIKPDYTNPDFITRPHSWKLLRIIALFDGYYEGFCKYSDAISDFDTYTLYSKDINTLSPFSNLDSADIISLLVCGQPYNYNTFMRAALEAGNITLETLGYDFDDKKLIAACVKFLDKKNEFSGEKLINFLKLEVELKNCILNLYIKKDRNGFLSKNSETLLPTFLKLAECIQWYNTNKKI